MESGSLDGGDDVYDGIGFVKLSHDYRLFCLEIEVWEIVWISHK